MWSPKLLSLPGLVALGWLRAGLGVQASRVLQNHWEFRPDCPSERPGMQFRSGGPCLAAWDFYQVQSRSGQLGSSGSSHVGILVRRFGFVP